MKKVREHFFGITIAMFLCMGACTVVFGKTELVQGGLTSLFWAIALLIFGYITMGKNERDLKSFDMESRNILIDLGTYGVESDYYGLYDASVLNKMRAKYVKKSHKQVFGVFAMGVILLICAFVFIF